MKSIKLVSLIVTAGLGISSILTSCTKSTVHESQTTFTKADSLTDKYLELEDSMLVAWNKLISDDNVKIRTMHNLVHELLVSGQYDKDELITMENRLNQLSEISFTQESIKDPILVEEYDFATNTLVSELVTLAESHEAFAHNKVLQSLVEGIKQADQRVEENRSNYDMIADEFNKFIDHNKTLLTDIEAEKKALFQMISTE
jgi:hypothetical protein